MLRGEKIPVPSSTLYEFNEPSQFFRRPFPVARLPLTHRVAHILHKSTQTRCKVNSSRLGFFASFVFRHQLLCLLQRQPGMNHSCLKKFLERGSLQLRELVKDVPTDGQLS